MNFKNKQGVSFLESTLLLILFNGLAFSFVNCQAQTSDYYMLVGTYTGTGSKGIYVYKFNPLTGKEKLVSTMPTIKNPSYLTVHGNSVYAVSETNGDEPGSVYSFHFDKKEGKLHFLNSLPSGGDDPCYLEADATGKFLTVANYSGGNLSLFHIAGNGSLSENKQWIQHEGSGLDTSRQKSPHVHQSVFSPDQKFLLTPDLGKDRVVIYRFEKNREKPLKYYSEIICTPGNGPRHIVFHPSLKVAYLINELNPVVEVYSFNGGNFKKIQELKGWSPGFIGAKDGAEIIVSADGKFLYTSHRAEQNEIGTFKIDSKTGKLTNVKFQSCGGKGPRFITIDPTGNWLFSANQTSNNITVFKRNKKTGALKQSGYIDLPIPVCIQFIDTKE